MKKTNLSILLLVLALSVLACNAQSRSNRIYRPCPATTSLATVEVEKDGDIDLTACSGRSIVLSGLTQITNGTSPSGLSITSTNSFLGDFNNNSNGTYLRIIDSSSTYAFNADASAAGIFALQEIADYQLNRTITAGGTTGNRTINKTAGTVNFAAAATAITVTNSLVTTSSLIFTTIRTADATCTFVKSTVPGSGSFVITLNAGCTAETSVGFLVLN